MLEIKFAGNFERDIDLLKKDSPKFCVKLLELIIDIDKHAYTGLGKPEALKGDLSGWWSRRISDKHRLIYRIKDSKIEVASCYGHYGDK
ncbi:MAG: Txe/YoeB family addiction module toxin [Bacteroidia bacterium]|nr:Txe/YoeB family addiction module toxin [Bacteroidia bacterium]